jgi:hypothetical protein
MDKRHHSSKSARMEDDLNRNSFSESGRLSGYPTPDRAPRTERADSCEPTQGTAHSHKAIPAVQSQPIEGFVAETGPGAAPSQVGPAAGPCVVARGGEAQDGLVHGASYGGFTPLRKNSSLVDDDEAAKRLEYQYQKVLRQSSRTHSHRDTGGRPRSGVQGTPPRSSLDRRQGESRSSYSPHRMEAVLARMEAQMAASTAAIAKMTASNASTSGPGEYISFLLSNC